MEIVRVVLLVAVSTAVAALMLYVFGGWPKALPYGEPMPYITFKNTTRGIQLGVFDYSNAPVTAHIYVNGRYAGSGRGWTDVYVKCGDYVEALFQYNGFARKVEGRISCSKPFKSTAAGGVVVFGSRTPLEAEATFSSLGIEITTQCVEKQTVSGTKYIYTLYPVFYVRSKKAMFLEYHAGLNRYATSGLNAVLRIDTGGVNTLRGVFRSYIHPPYGYSVSDYAGSRNTQMNFVVEMTDYQEIILGSYVLAYASTKGYVEIDGARYELATCRYQVSSTVTRVVYEDDWYDVNLLEPDAVYEVFIISNSGNVYRQTFAFFPNNKAMRITTSMVQNPQPSASGFCADVNIGGDTYKMCGNDLPDALNAFTRFIQSASGIDIGQIYNEMKNVIATGEGYDKTFGDPWEYIYRGKTYREEIFVNIHISKDLRPGGMAQDFAWIAMPGVFKGLTAGGWDVFINMAPNKAILNSTTPPIVLTVST
ncbi:hypothetical protein [Pyrobaculum aerophilum]|uniref:hypothetical protein n=1 Tax=Pyrobaculum aerophilum TaxID=13773 RepID=UPI0023F0B6C3|nr:hypothetical protein [Pyrobaculum aerophilum]MCX8136725.1 hypothetical protein [Pyrobaculum aerophilum]